MTSPLPPLVLGNTTVQLLPHHLPDVGARLFYSATRPLDNLSADDARRLAEYFKLGACHAESLDRRHRRRHGRAA